MPFLKSIKPVMKLLHIDACIRENSRTLELSDALIKGFCCDRSVQLIHRDCCNISGLTEESLMKRNGFVARREFSDNMFDLAHEYSDADIIVISAPYWDLSFPAALKSYIENIMVSGITFRQTDAAPVGLSKASKLFYVTTSGGYIGDYNYGYDYIKAIAAMTGIGDTCFISAQGLDIIGNDPSIILLSAKKEATELIKCIVH